MILKDISFEITFESIVTVGYDRIVRWIVFQRFGRCMLNNLTKMSQTLQPAVRNFVSVPSLLKGFDEQSRKFNYTQEQ